MVRAMLIKSLFRLVTDVPLRRIPGPAPAGQQHDTASQTGDQKLRNPFSPKLAAGTSRQRQIRPMSDFPVTRAPHAQTTAGTHTSSEPSTFAGPFPHEIPRADRERAARIRQGNGVP